MRAFASMLVLLVPVVCIAQDKKTPVADYLKFQADHRQKVKDAAGNEFALDELKKSFSEENKKWQGKEVEGELIFMKLDKRTKEVAVHFGQMNVNGLAIVGLMPLAKGKELAGLRSGDIVIVNATILRQTLSVTKISKKD